METLQPLHPCAHSSAASPIHSGHFWSCVLAVPKAGCALWMERAPLAWLGEPTSGQELRASPVPGGVLLRAGACSAMGCKPQQVRLLHSSPWGASCFEREPRKSSQCLMELLWLQLGSSGVSVGTWLLFTNGFQNDPNTNKGCRKASVLLPRAPLSYQKMLWQGRGSLLVFLACIFVAFERPRQKLVMLITEGSVKMKIPASYMPLSLLYEVHRFSDVLPSFVLLEFLTITCSKASDSPLKYKQQIRSTQT